jgi:hypothetical protein
MNGGQNVVEITLATLSLLLAVLRLRILNTVQVLYKVGVSTMAVTVSHLLETSRSSANGSTFSILHSDYTGQHGWGKRNHVQEQQIVIVNMFPQSDLDKMYCPNGLHAWYVLPAFHLPVIADEFSSIVVPAGGEWAYECVDLATELESCGGCVASGDGQDCTAIPNALSVGCEIGRCSGLLLSSPVLLYRTEDECSIHL